jgi:hypothetical protein
VPQPIATWNPARGVWEVPQTENLLCEHLAVFSETWPSSGTTRNGQAYAQPTSAPRTDDSASSYAPLTDDDLLPTPGVAGGGKQIPEDATWSGKAAYKADGTKVQVHLDRVELLLATPNHRDYKGPPSGAWSEQASLPRDVLNLLPTPNASVSQDGESFETWEVRRQAALEKGYNGNRDRDAADNRGATLTDAAQPTRRGAEPEHLGATPGRAAEPGERPGAIAWGPYESAIRRWERVLGRPAPAPTEPSARGTQRLSPTFVEWMMGLPEGHVTNVPKLTRNEQLKALGNGVVPQQAYAALSLMLTPDRP